MNRPQEKFTSGPLASVMSQLEGASGQDESIRAKEALASSLQLAAPALAVPVEPAPPVFTEPSEELLGTGDILDTDFKDASAPVKVTEDTDQGIDHAEIPEAVVAGGPQNRRYGKLATIGAGIVALVYSAGLAAPGKLSDIKSVPYPIRALEAAEELSGKPMGKTKIISMSGKGAASISMTEAWTVTKRIKLMRTLDPQLYPGKYSVSRTKTRTHSAYSSRRGSVSITTGKGLIKRLIPVHDGKKGADAGWTLKAVVDADAFRLKQNDMENVRNGRTKRDPWVEQRMMKMYDINHARFYGNESIMTNFADRVFYSRCVDAAANQGMINRSLKKKINAHIEDVADDMAATDPRKAGVIRNLLPVRKIEYAGGKKVAFKKRLIPGHQDIESFYAGRLAYADVDVSGNCRAVK